MRKALIALVVLAAVGGGAYAYYNMRKTAPKVTVATAAVTRGDIVETVGATGTLQAVTTVQVGSQVSGNIAYLGADYNSLVKKGQVLFRQDSAQAALAVPCRDPGALAHALERVLADEDLRLLLAAEAQRRAEQEDAEHTARSFAALYADLAASR